MLPFCYPLLLAGWRSCCWPGQSWRDGACAGTPACPAPLIAAGIDCLSSPTCGAGRALTPDGLHCCWPQQVWSGGACAGDPACPDGRVADGETCVEPTAVAPPPVEVVDARSGQTFAEWYRSDGPMTGAGWVWKDASGARLGSAQASALNRRLKGTSDGAALLNRRLAWKLTGGGLLALGSLSAYAGLVTEEVALSLAAPALQLAGGVVLLGAGWSGQRQLLVIAQRELATPYDPR